MGYIVLLFILAVLGGTGYVMFRSVRRIFRREKLKEAANQAIVDREQRERGTTR